MNQHNEKLAYDYIVTKDWAPNGKAAAEAIMLLSLIQYIVNATKGTRQESINVHCNNWKVVRASYNDLKKAIA